MTKPGDSSLHPRVADQLHSSHAPTPGRKNACENFGAAVYLGSLINRDDYHCNLHKVCCPKGLTSQPTIVLKRTSQFGDDLQVKYNATLVRLRYTQHLQRSQNVLNVFLALGGYAGTDCQQNVASCCYGWIRTSQPTIVLKRTSQFGDDLQVKYNATLVRLRYTQHLQRSQNVLNVFLALGGYAGTDCQQNVASCCYGWIRPPRCRTFRTIMVGLRSRLWRIRQYAAQKWHRMNTSSTDLDEQPRTTRTLFRPLDPGEIRLLKLCPGSFHEPLQAELENVALSTTVPYKAISYCWGKGGTSETIHISHNPVPITKSLHGALRRFRDHNHIVYLWADAICINQKDDAEKGVQISVMSIIFAQAEEVLIWLGEHQPQDTMAFCTISWLADYGRHLIKPETGRLSIAQLALLCSKEVEIIAAFNEHYFDNDVGDRALGRLLMLPGKSKEILVGLRSNCACRCCGTEFTWRTDAPIARLNEGLGAIKAVLDLPWFTRLWVIQENAVAQVAKVHLGQHCIPWTDLDLAIQVANFEDKMAAYGGLPRTVQFVRAFAIIELVSRYRLYDPLPGSLSDPTYLLAVLMRMSHFQCEREEDRLYSVRAVAFIEAECSLDPAFGQPVDHLWQQVAAYLLRKSPSWDYNTRRGRPCNSFVLTMAGIQRRNREKLRSLPSWVPDITAIDDEVRRRYEFALRNSRYHAAGGRANRFINYIDKQSWTLYARGGGISIIERMSHDTNYMPRAYNNLEEAARARDQDFELRLIPWYFRCLSFAYERAENSKADPACYSFRTLLSHGSSCNRKPMDAGSPVNEEYRNVYLPFFLELERDNASRSIGLDAETMCEHLENLIRDKRDRQRLDSSRVLAWTSDGRVGWVPQNSREGDVVVLLEGAPEPYVVRERAEGDGTCTLIGDAYIHGIMLGEAWEHDHEMNDCVISIK
nr:heterokaryon incompatibility protein 6, or allele [Quercus suber]